MNKFPPSIAVSDLREKVRLMRENLVYQEQLLEQLMVRLESTEALQLLPMITLEKRLTNEHNI